MTPFELDQLRQEHSQQQEQAALDRYLEGSTDAGFGQPPQFTDLDYLTGYLATIQRLPRDSEGKILYSSPHQQFAYGWVDSPDKCNCEF